MSRILLLAFFLFPYICSAQYFPPDELAENRVDKTTGQNIKRTYWHVMQRAVFRNPLNTFYRLSKINGAYFMELKVVKGDVKPFVVARGEELRLGMENGEAITLYNPEYLTSCAGCGSRADRENGPQGVTIKYRIDPEDVKRLQNCYINRIRIYFGEMCFESPVKLRNSEIFFEGLNLLDGICVH